MRRKLTRLTAASAGALAIGLAVSVVAATGAAAASNLPGGGVATLVKGGTATPLATNTFMPSNTLFDIRLPSGSVCSSGGGNGTQVGSFLVPEGTNLATMTFGATSTNSTANAVGVVAQGVALTNAAGFKAFDNAQSSPSGTILSADLTGFEMDGLIAAGMAVGPGPEPPLPNNNLIATAPSADWETGMVCFDPTSHEADFWAVPITFAINANDPGGRGFEWSIRTVSGVLPEAPLAVGLPLGGIAVIGGAVFINRRRRRTQPIIAA